MTNLEMLRTGTPKQIADMLCECLENCGACPRSIYKCCDAGKNGFAEWLNEETIAPKDAPNDAPMGAPKDIHAPRGWIKLKTPKSAIYIDASKIVGLGAPSTAVVLDELRTAVYTIGAEDNPWIVCDRIDEVMEKIKKASQEE